MRLLHTADWHLGRVLGGETLLPEQTEALERLVDLAVHEKPDAVLVAGDIYDRTIPHKEAIQVLNDALERLVEGAGIPVIAIAGNHDGPERLDFAAGMLSGLGLHLSGTLRAPLSPVTLEDRHGPVQIWPIPYAEPGLVRHALADETLDGHDAALGAVLGLARAAAAPRARQVVVAHAYVLGGDPEGDQLRPTALGNTGGVQSAHFDGFHYAALGHLHRPHGIGPRLRYAGSLFPCAFDEAGVPRTASLVEIDAAGGVRIDPIRIETVRTLRVVTGTFAELMAPREAPGDDIVQIVLTDDAPVMDAERRLRAIWPKLRQVRQTWLVRQESTATLSGPVRQGDPASLFPEFWRDVFGEALGTEDAAEADAALKAARE